MNSSDKIIKNYTKTIVFTVLYICIVVIPLQAMEEVMFVQTRSSQFKQKLKSYDPDAAEKAILTREYTKGGSPAPFQLISEKANFQWSGHEIKFLQPHFPFLDKVKTLELGRANYNHLCLTLYAVYEENGNLQVVESPLFAEKEKKALFLNTDGMLQKGTTVKFYTKVVPDVHDRWAYFVTHDGESVTVTNDQNIFPISARSYECGVFACNPICKQFYAHDGLGICQHRKNACRCTEPHALFHVQKHADELFAPLIAKAQNVNKIKSIGVRFFSYYQPCSECAVMLHGHRNISLAPAGGTEQPFDLEFIYYFNRTYLPQVIKINDDQHQLINSSNVYIYSGFIKNGLLYNSEQDQLGASLGYINLAPTVDLATKSCIYIIQWFKNFNVNNNNSHKIYYY